VVAIFGNEEFENTKRKLKREYSDIIWLDDEQVQVKGVDIFGTTGVLDEPTAWQSKAVPGITKITKIAWKRSKPSLQSTLIPYC